MGFYYASEKQGKSQSMNTACPSREGQAGDGSVLRAEAKNQTLQFTYLAALSGYTCQMIHHNTLMICILMHGSSYGWICSSA